MTLDYIPVMPSQQRDVALYLKQQFEKVGIGVKVRRSRNFSEWAGRVGNWDFDMTMDSVYNWGDPVIGVHRTYLSDNIRKGVIWSNTQNYKSNRVDEILAQAAVEMDREKRKALYREFQQILTDDLPMVWINVLPFHTVYNAGLRNPPATIWGIHAPFDQLYWKKRPAIKYVSTPVLDKQSPSLEQAGVRAIRLLKEKGLYGAMEVLKDPGKGFLDLKGSGFHVIGFTRKGIVFLDNSGQMKTGMDMSGIIDLAGKKVLPQLLEAAKGKDGGIFKSRGIWPHPKTHKVDPVSAWCGKLTRDDAVCAIQWEEKKGEQL